MSRGMHSFPCDMLFFFVCQNHICPDTLKNCITMLPLLSGSGYHKCGKFCNIFVFSLAGLWGKLETKKLHFFCILCQ